MKNLFRVTILLTVLAMILSATVIFAKADTEKENAAETAEASEAVEETAEASESNIKSVKAISAAVIIAVAAGVGAISMAIAVKHAVNSSARQPEAAGNIRTSMMMGLVFIETAIIYALIVAILVIFVL